eukprot:1270560-Pleurochrysis_carterae.AAC.5
MSACQHCSLACCWPNILNVRLTLGERNKFQSLSNWGLAISQMCRFLPYLRIAYRMGSLNNIADLMSRYPLDLKKGKHFVVSIPNDLFDILASVEVHGKPAVYLCEP